MHIVSKLNMWLSDERSDHKSTRTLGTVEQLRSERSMIWCELQACWVSWLTHSLPSDAVINIHFAKQCSITMTNACGKQFRERKDGRGRVVSVVAVHGF